MPIHSLREEDRETDSQPRHRSQWQGHRRRRSQRQPRCRPRGEATGGGGRKAAESDATSIAMARPQEEEVAESAVTSIAMAAATLIAHGSRDFNRNGSRDMIAHGSRDIEQWQDRQGKGGGTGMSIQGLRLCHLQWKTARAKAAQGCRSKGFGYAISSGRPPGQRRHKLGRQSWPRSSKAQSNGVNLRCRHSEIGSSDGKAGPEQQSPEQRGEPEMSALRDRELGRQSWPRSSKAQSNGVVTEISALRDWVARTAKSWS